MAAISSWSPSVNSKWLHAARVNDMAFEVEGVMWLCRFIIRQSKFHAWCILTSCMPHSVKSNSPNARRWDQVPGLFWHGSFLWESLYVHKATYMYRNVNYVYKKHFMLNNRSHHSLLMSDSVQNWWVKTLTPRIILVKCCSWHLRLST